MPTVQITGPTRHAVAEGIRNSLPPGTQAAQLVIRVANQRLSVRGFTAYLRLLDSAYGRASPLGYRSYALRESEHLKIARIEKGSIELEFLVELIREVHLWQLGFVYMIARLLPGLAKGEFFKNWAEGVKAIAEARSSWNKEGTDRENVLAPVRQLPSPAPLPETGRSLGSHLEVVPYEPQPLIRFSKKQQ
jgi:hypothetical protein